MLERPSIRLASLSFARVLLRHFLDLCHDLNEVVGLRVLQLRELWCAFAFPVDVIASITDACVTSNAIS
jgi:hypothetical protein